VLALKTDDVTGQLQQKLASVCCF